MKITKATLKRLIKEELELMHEEDTSDTPNFRIVSDSGLSQGRSIRAYVTNVPDEMIDRSGLEGTEDYVDPNRLLRLTPEAFKRIMGRNRDGYLYDVAMQGEIPETVRVMATVNLRTGKVVDSETEVPRIIDASTV